MAFQSKSAMALQPLGKYLESKSDWMWVSPYTSSNHWSRGTAFLAGSSQFHGCTEASCSHSLFPGTLEVLSPWQWEMSLSPHEVFSHGDGEVGELINEDGMTTTGSSPNSSCRARRCGCQVPFSFRVMCKPMDTLIIPERGRRALEPPGRREVCGKGSTSTWIFSLAWRETSGPKALGWGGGH